MPRSRVILADVHESLLDTSCWPMPNVDALSPQNQKIFYARYHSVIDYIQKIDLKSIEAKYGIDKSNIVKYVKRCLEKDENYCIQGFQALIPQRRLKKYIRKAESNIPFGTSQGLSGAFHQLLAKYPELEKQIHFLIFKKYKKHHIHQSRMSISDVHLKFLEKCRELNLQTKGEYPFNTSSLGIVSLGKYVKQILSENASLAANYFGKEYETKMTVGTGTNRPVFCVLDRVECDAHKIDAVFCLLVPSPFGDIVPLIVERVWLITTQDVASKVILGYHLSLRKEINKDDVLRCIANSVTKWQPVEADYLNYQDNGGFPSGMGKEYTGIKWKELSVDGAMANLSQKVHDKLHILMGISPVVLPKRNKDDRPFVERFFRTLETRGFHKLPNTTGSSSTDSLRDKPEIKACKYFIQLEEIHGLIDCMIADYNGTPHSNIGRRTPLEYFKFKVDAKLGDIAYVDDQVAKSLLLESKNVTVKGNQAKGIRPYINFEYTKYSSPLFNSFYSLCGKKISIQFNVDDLRTIKAFFPDGSEIGSLSPSPPWHLYPHSIYVKRAIFSLVNKKHLILSPNVNPVETFLKYHEEQLSNKRRVSNAYIEARRDFTNAFDEVKAGTNNLHNANIRLREIEAANITKNSLGQNTEMLPPKRKAKC